MGKRSRNMSDSEVDEITPCTVFTDSHQTCLQHIPQGGMVEDGRQSRPSSPSHNSDGSGANTPSHAIMNRRNSIKTLEEGTNGDPERLWNRMLALQQTYGCYRSARMSAALELKDARSLLPSKACLNLMNEDMNALPVDVEIMKKLTEEPICASNPKS